MEKPTIIFLITLTPLVFLNSKLSGAEYGSRINLPEDSFVTADFIDKDKNGIDDRYQKGPRRNPITKEKLVLPKVEYIGETKQGDIKDLKFGVEIYEEYARLKRNLPSRLIQLNETVTDKTIKTLAGKHFKGIIFSYPNEVTIFQINNVQSGKLIIKSGNTYLCHEILSEKP